VLRTSVGRLWVCRPTQSPSLHPFDEMKARSNRCRTRPRQGLFVIRPRYSGYY
jgi:hypothetical protein